MLLYDGNYIVFILMWENLKTSPNFKRPGGHIFIKLCNKHAERNYLLVDSSYFP